MRLRTSLLGNNLEAGFREANIFHDDVDRQDFLKTLAETCHKADFLGGHDARELKLESAAAKAERIVA